MRLAGKEKLGYYPTNEPVLDILKTWVAQTGKGRLFDPCCGKGIAAAIMGAHLDSETWGVELSPFRYEEAKERMTLVHNAAWQVCSLTNECISTLFLNPPYDTNEKGIRMEHEFLLSTTPKLMKGGILIYIVPQKIIQDKKTADYLFAWYEDHVCFKFPFELFPIFNQVVFIAKKRKLAVKPTREDVMFIETLAANAEHFPISESPMFVAPEAPALVNNKIPLLKRHNYTDEQIATAAEKKGVYQTKEYLDLMDPKRNEKALDRPAMPLKKGHIAMLMASGMMKVLRLNNAGSPMLVKGRVIKVVDTTTKEDESDGSTIEKKKDRFVTTVTALTQDGVEVIDNVKALTDFMMKHGEEIAKHIIDTYKPLYNFDPTPEENRMLDSLGKGRKPLPGQKEAGLLPTQRHASAALYRAIKKHGTANMQGEMGVGKSGIGAAVLDMLDAYPAIVLCPPHLVEKWIRELKEVSTADGIEMTMIGCNSDGNQKNDVARFLHDFDERKHRTGKTPKMVAVIANTAAKYSSGWESIDSRRKAYLYEGDKPVKENGKNKVIYSNIITCPGCGKEAIDNEGNFIHASDIGGKMLFCHNDVIGWTTDDDGNKVWAKKKCNTPLFERKGTRTSISDYILNKCKGRFKLLIADEAHEFKSQDTDRGIAFHQLVVACKYTLTLTGTFFGGKSTSIFWLLHRLSKDVRRDFGFHDAQRWSRLYGVLEMVTKIKDTTDDFGYTGNKRYKGTPKELPGVSPEIIGRLLYNTIFLSMNDLGVKMPEYKETVSSMDMDTEQQRQYSGMTEYLKARARNDNRFLSQWLQWSLARPNSGFRDEEVTANVYQEVKGKMQITGKDVVYSLPKIDIPLLPKEEWLANFIAAEKMQGRKVLVYIRCTGTRDIRDRVKEVLETKKVRVKILNESVNPRKREEWIKNNIGGMDAMLVNPNLVKTGLDLIDFATVVFYEIEYSLYTLWQAVRRVWRLGQTKPVKAVFSIYRSSLEEQALKHIGNKMKAAQLVYGDEVGGAIVEEQDDDLMSMLAKDILSGAKLADLQSLFAEEPGVSSNPLGSMTVQSEVISDNFTSWTDWAKARGVVIIKKSRKVEVPKDQLSLF